MGKRSVGAYFKVASQSMPGGTEEIYEFPLFSSIGIIVSI